MVLILNVIIVVIAHSAMSEKVPDLTHVEKDFSPETFAHFNITKKHKKFTLQDLEALSRRWDYLWYSWFVAKQVHTYQLNMRSCLNLAATYISAIPNIRRYFEYRFLYVNTKEYEIGYLTYDIVQKYQMIVEIYHIVFNKYYSMPKTNVAPTQVVFYLYRNTLELGMAIHHLCNMLHEIEPKYAGAPVGVWDDYPEDDGKSGKGFRNTTDKSRQAYQDYLKRRNEEQRKRRRQRRRDRKNLNFDTEITTPDHRPKHHNFWPLHYGWSIEYW